MAYDPYRSSSGAGASRAPYPEDDYGYRMPSASGYGGSSSRYTGLDKYTSSSSSDRYDRHGSDDRYRSSEYSSPSARYSPPPLYHPRPERSTRVTVDNLESSVRGGNYLDRSNATRSYGGRYGGGADLSSASGEFYSSASSGATDDYRYGGSTSSSAASGRDKSSYSSSSGSRGLHRSDTLLDVKHRRDDGSYESQPTTYRGYDRADRYDKDGYKIQYRKDNSFF